MSEIQLYRRVGKKIREVRESKNLSQQALADMCNFEKSNMSRIEAGKNNLTLKTLEKIAIGLGVKIKDLLDFE
jgi:transcriptional regulator with XRE-family HTH domain